MLVIGLDGATWRVLDPLMAEGRLPTLKKLICRGIRKTLISTIPPTSIPAWNSLASGINPSKLGALNKLEKYSYRLRLAWFAPFRGKNVWDVLSRRGYRVIVANVPHIRYAYRVRGSMVAGFLCTDPKRLAYPPFLKGRLDRETGGYKTDIIPPKFIPIAGIDKVFTKREILKKVYELDIIHFNAFKMLLEEKWDLGFFVFIGPDRIQHISWDFRILGEYFNRLDKILYKLLKEVDEQTTIFIVSDHGFGPGGRVFYINEWLAAKGYLRYRRHEKAKKIVRIREIIEEILEQKLEIPPLFFTRLLPAQILDSIVERYTRSKYQIDWRQTSAFSLGVEGEIWINVRNKMPYGKVVPENYELIMDKLIEDLRDIKDSNGKRININIFRKEELKYDDTDDYVADLRILVNDDIPHIQPTIGTNRVFGFRKTLNTHRIDGIALICRKGTSLKDATDNEENIRIYDIAPTILSLFGCYDALNSCDGKVIKIQLDS